MKETISSKNEWLKMKKFKFVAKKMEALFSAGTYQWANVRESCF